MKNGVLQHLNPWQKVAISFIIVFLALLIFGIIDEFIKSVLLNTNSPEEVISDLTRIDSIRMIKITNLLFHIVVLIIPALILTKLFNYDFKNAILIKSSPKFVWIILPFLFLGLTFINDIFSYLNHQIDFSFISDSMQKSFKYQQAIQAKTAYAYVGETWKSFFINIILIALIPAISEELFFRGVLQNLLSKASNNIWIGITTSALLFALIHRQPFNFLPIFTLGFFYGIIAAFTGSIWITITLHFLNNGLKIGFAHLQRMYEWNDPEISLWVYTIVIAFTGVIIFAGVKLNLIPSRWHETKGIYLR